MVIKVDRNQEGVCKRRRQTPTLLKDTNFEDAQVSNAGSTECFRDLDKLNSVKFGYGGLDLGSSQYLLLSQLPQKMILPSKVVKSDSKIIISLR